MNTGLFSHGKLLPLPRVSVSYRQLNFKLLRVTTWLVMLFAVAGQASAAYTPSDVAALLSSSKPVSPVKTTASLALNAPVVPVTSTDNRSAAKTALPEDNSRPIPEISMEIKDAEYIPPAPKPILRPVFASPSPAQVTSGSFPFGQCTYYVATRRNVSWSGNAWEWFGNAKAVGMASGNQPKAGAVMVTWESAIGHVAYVESVNANGTFTVSEMNYGGYWGRVNTRTIRVSDVPLIGFIY